jgi:hypothetical protein
VRFREGWLIATDAARFFFPPNTSWTTLTEVRVNDANGATAGNIDVVCVSYDRHGTVTGYGALEVQSVYISGNIRGPFQMFMSERKRFEQQDWRKLLKYPRPDFLSSSRKRLAPQLMFKGGIIAHWGRKMAVALDRSFFETLPALVEVPRSDADLAWFVYELRREKANGRYQLCRYQTVYTRLEDSMRTITQPVIGEEQDFIAVLQSKLRLKLSGHDSSSAANIEDNELQA